MAALSPEQLAFFIQHGYLILKPSVKIGHAVHKLIRRGAVSLDARQEKGNNCVPMLPEISEVLDAPELVGALTTILGDGYVLMPHRHCHVVDEESPSQPFHRDSFFSFEQFRHWFPMEVMVCYYPQAVTLDMGPTAVIPGSQYHQGRLRRAAMELSPGGWGDTVGQEMLTSEEPGMCVLMHYHLWHRASSRAEGREAQEKLKREHTGDASLARYMIKLQFRRVRSFKDPLPRQLTEAFAAENPYLHFCNNVSVKADDESLPCALVAVPPQHQDAWIAMHACMWALVWHALAQGRQDDRHLTKQTFPWSQLARTPDTASEDVEGSMLGMSAMQIAKVLRTAPMSGSSCYFAAAFAAAACTATATQAAESEQNHVADGRLDEHSSVRNMVPELVAMLAAQDADMDVGIEAESKVAEVPDHGAHARWGSAEACALLAWLGMRFDRGRLPCVPAPADARWFAAAALQLLPAPCPPGSKTATQWMTTIGSALNHSEMQAFAADWRSEALLATPAILAPEDAIIFLAPYLRPYGEPRVQFHAAVALYATGMRCGAPEHAGWASAADKVNLGQILLDGIIYWVEFAAEVHSILQQELKRRRTEDEPNRMCPVQPQDGGGRYGLAEMLRCIGAFCSRDIVLRAYARVGGDLEFVCSGDDAVWRGEFNLFVQRHFVCPITSPYSPF
mmetsp:Transcript_36847/g.84927  ORF Transcript_36847/g.84927 Transcript_36847/m.84927 type:complete len:677 (+) Transcript_36847:97-2127(+)